MPSLLYYLRRARELRFRETLHEAQGIVAGRVMRTAMRAYDHHLRKPIHEDEILRRCGFSSPSLLGSHFKTRRSPAFFIKGSLDDYRAALAPNFPGESEKILNAAHPLMRHTVDLLGSGPTDLDAVSAAEVKVIGPDGKIRRTGRSSGYLPWNVDFKSGVGWDPGTYYKDIRYGQLAGVDVKVPWELSRFQHLLPLGQAYCITYDERYAREFVAQVLDWIENNPCRYGVNWSCTMEVGIRAVNWIWSFYLFRQSQAVDERFIRKFLTSLYAHALFIRANLEYRTAWVNGKLRRLNSNHYLADLIGLLYVSLLFPEFKMQEDCKFAASELEIELFEQTSADGVDYERSTFYHRLALEIFLSGFLLLRMNGWPIRKAVVERLLGMAEFVADYLRPDGLAPQIGDADNGRLHPLSVRHTTDHRYLPWLVAAAFNDEKLTEGDREPELLWWLGPHFQALSPRKRVAEGRVRGRTSRGYREAGFFIMHGANTHVVISAATVGIHGFGSHSHNDILSFDHWANGRPWIVDPGTFVYTPDPEARNLLRSAESHNTVRIDKEEINPFHSESLFQIRDQARVFVHQWTTDPDCDVLDIEHTGYLRLPNGVRHRRRFSLNKQTGELTIRDSFDGSGLHLFEWFFHLHPSIQVQLDGSRFTLKSSDQVQTMTFDATQAQREIVMGWYSPSYGVRRPAPIIVCGMNAVVPFSVGVCIAQASPER